MENLETIVLSHWHRDHSGGILNVLDSVKAARERTNTTDSSVVAPVKVDLHPSRPMARGIAPPPTYARVLARIPEDPTFDEIREHGGEVDLHAEPHAVAGGTVWVSGEIPRVNSFEQGLFGSVRWVGEHEVGDPVGEPRNGGKWISEPVRRRLLERGAGSGVLNPRFPGENRRRSWTSDMWPSMLSGKV